MKQAQHVASVADITNSHKISVSKFKRKNHFRDPDGETVWSIV
jgi:hypothetical protein